ncbi:MAG TPA: hypothetical protein VFY84_04870 [Jiangellales bacterium]|nr:hypothetical protein [Jiangellales bacterium]
MPRALKNCSQPGCWQLVPHGRCDTHRREAEQRRGTRQQRGYGQGHDRRFRPAVLRRDPLCVCTDQHGTHGPQCLRPSTVADHWPLSKRELRARGMDDNDPANGRGLCGPCHSWWTTQAQPGGWHAERHAV